MENFSRNSSVNIPQTEVQNSDGSIRSSSSLPVTGGDDLPSKVSVHSWWILAVVTALYVASYLDRFILTLVVPDVKTSLGLTDTQMGLVLGPAFALAYALFSLPAGWIADRFSRSMVIFWGAVLFAIATAMTGMVNSFGMLLLCRVAVGIGESTLVPAALSILAQAFPKDRVTTAVAIFSSGPKFGVAVAYALGGVIVAASIFFVGTISFIQDMESWRLVFILTGLPSLLLGVLCLTFRGTNPPKIRADSDHSDDAIGFIISRKSLFLPMLLGTGAVLICGQGLVAWVPSYLDREFSWQALSYGPILGAVSLLGAGTLVIKGLIMERLFSRGITDIHLRFFTWLLFWTYPIAVALFLLPDRLSFVLAYAIISVITIPCAVYPSIVIQMVTPATMRGRVFAIYSIPMIVLGGLGAPIVGVITDFLFNDQDKLGWSMAILMSVFLPVGVVFLRLALPGLRTAIKRAV